MGKERRVAVLSDVHANVVALRAVLADLDRLGVEEIVVAGDVVGFGASPAEVVDLLLARQARLIRGNWEADYVAACEASGVPDAWLSDPNKRPIIWLMEQLGPERRALLASLPDRLALDGSAAVVHGTPRSVREGVTAATSDADLAAALGGEPAGLVFVGHTHVPLDRAVGRCRVVNPGSVGLPIDGDSRAAYAVATLAAGGSETWQIEWRRVGYDLDAAIAAYADGLGREVPWFATLIAHQLRRARNYYAGWLKQSAGLAESEIPAALESYLAASP